MQHPYINKTVEGWVRTKNVQAISKYFFPNYKPAQDMKKSQVDIVRRIAYSENQRLCINAMTRYGKSACVALGVVLYLWLHKRKKVAIIAPQDEQAGIIRNYIAEITSQCYEIARLVEMGATANESKFDRLKREASRRRWTFKNGCELLTISAHGEANRLMGFGADLIILDEAALVSRDAYARIVRMLGDDPENSMLIELANPWNIDNKYYEHYVSGRFDVIHIGYETALKEGRITQTFVDEMREELTPIEFNVLYESKFPDEAEDSLFRRDWIQKAIDTDSGVMEGKKIISCDVADKGLDKTVIMWGYELGGTYHVVDIYSENLSDNMGVANKIISWVNEKGADVINIDCIGIGAGVVSRLKEVYAGDNSIMVKPCHFGESPAVINTKQDNKTPTSKRKRFMNKKAEQYFRLRDLMENNLLDIPNMPQLKTELMKMTWDLTGAEKIRVIDPEEKSPDFSDALCYFTWKDKHDVGWFFG